MCLVITLCVRASNSMLPRCKTRTKEGVPRGLEFGEIFVGVVLCHTMNTEEQQQRLPFPTRTTWMWVAREQQQQRKLRGKHFQRILFHKNNGSHLHHNFHLFLMPKKTVIVLLWGFGGFRIPFQETQRQTTLHFSSLVVFFKVPTMSFCKKKLVLRIGKEDSTWLYFFYQVIV